MGPVTTAAFDDTCSNPIQIAHRNYARRRRPAADRDLDAPAS